MGLSAFSELESRCAALSHGCNYCQGNKGRNDLNNMQQTRCAFVAVVLVGLVLLAMTRTLAIMAATVLTLAACGGSSDAPSKTDPVTTESLLPGVPTPTEPVTTESLLPGVPTPTDP